MKKILSFIGLALISSSVYGQGSPDYGGGLKINLNPKGDKYVRFILQDQFWIRNSDMNPGSMVGGEPTDNTWNLGNRNVYHHPIQLMTTQNTKEFNNNNHR